MKRIWIFIICLIGFYVLFLRKSYRPSYKQLPFRQKMKTWWPIVHGKMGVLNSLESGQLYHYGGYNQSRDFDKAVSSYTETIKKGDMSGYCYLARLYHEGMPDTVPPNANEAIRCYWDAVRHGYHSHLLDIGDILQWGLHGDTQFTTNRSAARMTYQMLANKNYEPYSEQARDRLQRMHEEDYSYPHLIQDNVMDGPIIHIRRHRTTQDAGAPLRNTVNPAVRARLRQNDLVDDIDNYDLTEFLHILDNQPTRENIPIRLWNDNQNVHDSHVVKSLRHAVEHMSQQLVGNGTRNYTEIQNFLNTLLDKKKKDNALRTFTEMTTQNKMITSQNMRETDALQLVWNYVHHSKYSPEEQTSLRNILASQLASGVEYDSVVCPVGRMSRVLDTFTGIDPSINVRTVEILREEILNKAEKVKNDMLTEEDNSVKNAIDSTEPNDRQQEMINEFSNRYQKHLLDCLHNDYVQTNIMSETQLQNEIKPWIGHLI